MKRIGLLTPVLFLLSAIIAAAQSSQGSINGTVFDQTGSVVAGATVTITNIGTANTIS